MSELPTREPVVIVHQAGTWTEALVIRGLLESAGINSPASTFTDPFPLREPPKGTHGVEILVLSSQADEARRIIADYLAGGDTALTNLESAETPSEV
ncbi:MAG TPA: hypothetical protein VHM88_06110 [Candidatus Acidoferrales bacterium]|nr:hypothetical protein [Candidatus Acidoferrales bacterium]